MCITITALDGAPFTVELDLDSSVRDLKRRLVREHGVVQPTCEGC